MKHGLLPTDWIWYSRRSPWIGAIVSLLVATPAPPALSQILTPLVNQGQGTYQTPNDPTPLNGVTNTVTTGRATVAGVRVEVTAPIDWDNNGLFLAGDYISFTFQVTNLSNIANPLRIPSQVRTLNLGSVGRGVVNATNGGSECHQWGQ